MRELVDEVVACVGACVSLGAVAAMASPLAPSRRRAAAAMASPSTRCRGDGVRGDRKKKTTPLEHRRRAPAPSPSWARSWTRRPRRSRRRRPTARGRVPRSLVSHHRPMKPRRGRLKRSPKSARGARRATPSSYRSGRPRRRWAARASPSRASSRGPKLPVLSRKRAGAAGPIKRAARRTPTRAPRPP